jgi:hypothetical protein
MSKTKRNTDRKESELVDHTSLNPSNGKLKPTEIGSGPTSRSASRTKQAETIPLKDRGWRGENAGEMWWECQWEGMDGIGGTNKKGRRCFDKMRISWRSVSGEQVQVVK